MEDNPYLQKLNQLVTGELAELVIEQAEFMLFRDAWRQHPQKNQIVGEAGLHGKIIYRFSETKQNS